MSASLYPQRGNKFHVHVECECPYALHSKLCYRASLNCMLGLCECAYNHITTLQVNNPVSFVSDKAVVIFRKTNSPDERIARGAFQTQIHDVRRPFRAASLLLTQIESGDLSIAKLLKEILV